MAAFELQICLQKSRLGTTLKRPGNLIQEATGEGKSGSQWVLEPKRFVGDCNILVWYKPGTNRQLNIKSISKKNPAES
jgi:hypothetical protein